MNKRKLASQQDRKVSEETGWKIEVNSGATKGRKGDLKTTNKPYNLLVETKTPEVPKKSFRLEEAWFHKLRDQAFSMQKDFHVLVFTFNQKDQYASLPLKDFNRIFNTMNELQDLTSKLQEELKTAREVIKNEDQSQP